VTPKNSFDKVDTQFLNEYVEICFMMDWKKICLNDHANILQAMRNLTETGARFSVVVSDNYKFLGTLTDGDIRRSLLSGLTVNESVTKAMNVNPIVALENASNQELREIMRTNDFTHIPVIDGDGKLVRILSLKEVQVTEPRKDNAVVLMVGGLGVRLGELTANCPKPMLKLGDKPILEIIIENFKEKGFYNFFLSVNYKSEVIESYFGDGSRYDINIKYIREKERMGTAGSLSLFESINDLPIIVMNGDVLTKVNFTSLIDYHNNHALDACICTCRHDYQIPFGVVHQDDNLVIKIEEKPIHSALINAGIYSMNPKLLSALVKNQFCDMPSFLEKIIGENKKVGTFQVQDYWLDIGRKDDFYRAEIDYKNKLK
jgi:dTDP-glucose pyrophosphorylase/CBS domain-containing protein